MNIFLKVRGPLTKPSSGIEPESKVTVVGAAGQVGLACVLSLVQQGIASEVAMCDMAEARVRGEALDIQHSLGFLKDPPRVTCSTDYSGTDNSKIVVITAGVRQQPGESRLSLLERNVTVYKSIIPQIISRSPDAILLIATNPCDIMAYVAWKLAGIPSHHVLSTGCNLDTGRFRTILADQLGIHTSSVHAWIIGEHGDSSVPVWSGVNVGTHKLRSLNSHIGMDDDPLKFGEVHRRVVDAADEIIKLKGYTNWGIGASVAQICNAILRDKRQALAVGSLVDGLYDVEGEVFQALPCIVGSDGVHAVVNVALSPEEENSFQESAKTLASFQSTILHMLPQKSP